MARHRGTITLVAGTSKTCTITNTRKGSIAIVKDTVPNDAQDFTFTPAAALSASTFLLDDDSDGTLLSTKAFTDVAPGTYTVQEATTSGFDLAALTCTDSGPGASTGDVPTRTATFNIEAGENVTCTFTNNERGKIIVEKQTLPNAAAGSFAFTGAATGSIGDGEIIEVSDLPINLAISGPYDVVSRPASKVWATGAPGLTSIRARR